MANGVTLLLCCFFGIKIPTTKHEIMLHAMLLNLPTALTGLSLFAYPDSLGWTESVRYWYGF